MPKIPPKPVQTWPANLQYSALGTVAPPTPVHVHVETGPPAGHPAPEMVVATAPLKIAADEQNVVQAAASHPTTVHE